QTVWHEIVSDRVHVDVHVAQPDYWRPYYTLVTSGMSDLPMTAPPGANRYAELMLCLPENWPMTASDFDDERAYWPIRLLKMVARLPHEYQTWIGPGHTVPNGDPAQPYAAGTPFSAVLATPPRRAPASAGTILVEDGRRISLLALLPLYPQELAHKLT